jgi:hypothetical protein
MPVSNASRYARLATYRSADASRAGQATIPARLQPTTPLPRRTRRHVVTGVESLEYLAWRMLGNSELWWRLADAGPRAYPLDLAPGMAITVPDPGDLGAVDRTRRF